MSKAKVTSGQLAALETELRELDLDAIRTGEEAWAQLNHFQPVMNSLKMWLRRTENSPLAAMKADLRNLQRALRSDIASHHRRRRELLPA